MANDEGISKPPLSPARLAANRRNAQKSTGPKTKAGKRRVALNARRLGFAPPEIERQLRARGEDPRDFRRLHRDVAGLFPPHDVTGEAAVRLLAMTWWEKARRKIERRLFAFGATKAARTYPRPTKLDGLLDEYGATVGDILAAAGQEAAIEPKPGVGRRVRRPKQSQFKAIGLKPLVVSNLCQNRKKPSHGDELALESVGYLDFRPVFRKVATDEAMLYIADLGGLVGGEQSQSKAKTHKANFIKGLC